MKFNLSALLSGILFGFGLVLADMTNPATVIAFLDVAGEWSATLALVMGGGLAVTIPAFYFIQRRKRPVLVAVFTMPTSLNIDKRLVTGAALFGLGWGLAGLCPGPAIAGLAAGNLDSVLFVVAMLIGFRVADLIK